MVVCSDAFASKVMRDLVTQSMSHHKLPFCGCCMMQHTLSSFSKPRTGGRTCTCSHLGCDRSTSASAPMRGARDRTKPELGGCPGSASTTLAIVVAAALASTACAAVPCKPPLACRTIMLSQTAWSLAYDCLKPGRSLLEAQPTLAWLLGNNPMLSLSACTWLNMTQESPSFVGCGHS